MRCSLDGSVVFRDHSLEFYRSSDLAALGDERSLPVSVADDQVAVRVAVTSRHREGKRLFGDEIVFVLTPEGHGYRISEMFEDFQLP